MLTRSIEVMQYVRASAGRAGISVVFEDVNQPRHDGKTIFLPRITSKTTEQELKEFMASTDHEVAHDRFSSFTLLKSKGVDPEGTLMFVWNLLEDSRINNIEAEEYRGFKDNWDESSSSIYERIVKNAVKDKSDLAKLTLALICWETTVSATNFPMCEMAANRVTPNKKIQDVLSNYSDRLSDCHRILNKELGTEATYQLALDILKDIGKQCPEEFKELPKPKKPSSGEGDSGKDSKEEKAAASKDGDQDGDSTKESSPPKDDEYKVINMKLTEDDLKKYSLSLPEEGTAMGHVGINFEPVDTSGHPWDLTDFNHFEVVNYPQSNGKAKFFTPVDDFLRNYEERVGSKLVSQETFAQEVRRIIQIRAKVQRQYGVKKGKLDQSRLSRICFNAPGFNERVFKNKIENKTLDAAITVLVDMSGSMGGDKAYYALASTLLVNQVCSVLNIPIEIVGFSDTYSSITSDSVPLMFVYKGFSDLRTTDEKLKEYFSQSSDHMQGNPDGENIVWVHNRLVKRKEKKKLLIVMSDGSPAASKSSLGLEEFTRQVIGEIQDSKMVDIYGLGLCSHEVTNYYKANSVVMSPEEIPNKLLELIERKIINV